MKKAVFPGSFDPITLGHYDIIQRGLSLFDHLVVAIGENSEKGYRFSLEERLAFLQKAFGDEPRIEITTYSGLTVDFCKSVEAQFILRGLRNPADFEFEKAIAHTNRTLSKIETVFLLTASDKAFISSSIVRDVLKHNGDISALVPQPVSELIASLGR
ncbi:MAG: pantetheine-phosphate adenylyltransferase [Flavobacteriaceae bacterium]|nr:pantetheine-phosphate adenylyltransferase [Flavobacteriaceae bacterium]